MMTNYTHNDVIRTPSTDADAIISHATQISGHLSKLINYHADDYPLILQGQYDSIIKDAEQNFHQDLSAATNDDRIMEVLRVYRGRISHLVAITDFLNKAEPTQHMEWLSHAAETALDGLAKHLAGENNPDWFILCLGKMGSGELNYSSDIDIIVITLNDYTDYDLTKKFVRWTRKITSLMSQPTKDGIAWRVDLRLRPDPGATPVAISRNAAMSYYESIARTWERAAFIRAKVVAGNREAGKQFLKDIRPFVWRKFLDYTVIDDLKIMLRREARPDDLLGYNVKNGIGGIRGIEFFVHAHQLIAGGRERNLRVHSTLVALHELAQNNWISVDAKENLSTAYLAWRRLEHRLQMVSDSQAHQLPKSEEAFSTFSTFCGHEDKDVFRNILIGLGNNVLDNTKDLMEHLNSRNNVQNGVNEAEEELPVADIILDNGDHETTHEILKSMGYAMPENITRTYSSWLTGRLPATRSPRARDLLLRLLPRILQQFSTAENPDVSFNAFSQLVENLPAGMQLFSLIESNNNIAVMLADISSSAPKLAEQIASYPMLADQLLYAGFWAQKKDWDGLEQELKDRISNADHFEDAIGLLRVYCREWKFQISLQLLQGAIKSKQAGEDFSTIADIIVSHALPLVAKEIERRYGKLKDGAFSIISLGRLGARELTFSSDLDLVFIYDHPESAVSDGKKSLPAKTYFNRFAQELINALSSLTAEGRCYEIDMRLRPAGGASPIALHYESFIQYQCHEAWIWEHLALTKSRYISGLNDEKLAKNLKKNIAEIIKNDRDPQELNDSTSEMIENLHKNMPPNSPYDMRSIHGGIMDIDLLVEMLQLMPDAKNNPLQQRSSEALSDLVKVDLISSEDAETIAEAIKFYSQSIQLMRMTNISIDNSKTPDTLLPTALQKRLNLTDYSALGEKIAYHADAVVQIMKKYVCKDLKRE